MWTTYDDIASRWFSGSIPADEAQVTTLIADAEDMILSEFPSVQARIDAQTLPVLTVQRVAARMVIRVLRNPTGQRSTTQGAGAFSQSITFGGDEPGALYLTDADRNDLRARNNGSGKVRSVSIIPTNAYVSSDEYLWVDL